MSDAVSQSLPRRESVEEQELDTAIRAYYARYYRDQLGLADWRYRVETRLDEENVFAPRLLDWIESWINYSFADRHVLVVGAGTGAETFALVARGARVTAIEPSAEAVRIIAAKARWRHQMPSPAVRAVGEHLPFRDGEFDFVVCYTVLEHTRHPIRCLDEMIRVVRRRGWIFIMTPDFRQFYEAHYKMILPLFAPRWLLRLWLRALGRPPEFLNSLQFVNGKLLTNALQDRPVTALRVIHSWPQDVLTHPTSEQRLMRWMARTFGIQRDQWWLIQKLEKPR